MAREHLKAFRAVEGVEIAGLQSRTLAKAEALASEFGGCAVYERLEGLLEKARPDLCVVAVNVMSMRAVAEIVLQTESAVLFEKPAGYELSEAEEIAGWAKGKLAMVALNRRHYSSTVAAAEDLAGSAATRFVRVQDQQSLAEARAVGHPEEVVRTWMYANSIHLVDYLCALCRGKVTEVQVFSPWAGESTEYVLASVKFDSGDIGTYECLWNGPGPWAVTATNSERRWEMRPLEKAMFQNRGERKLNEVEMHGWDLDFKPGFRRQAEEAVKAVRGEQSAAISLDDALETMRLVNSIYGV